MSKSKGNVLPLVEIPKKYGADVYRTYAISAAEPGSLMDWREKDVPAVKNRLKQYIQIVEKYGKKTSDTTFKKSNLTFATRWVLSRINSLINECTEHIEEFRLRDYAILATSEMIRIINQYMKREDVPKEERNSSLAYICDIWMRLMAPITPHTSEELWSKTNHTGYASLAQWPKADSKLIDEEVETGFSVIENTIRDIREIKKLLKGKKTNSVHMYVAPQWMYNAMNNIRDAELPLIVGEIMKHLMSNPEFRKYGKEVKTIVDRITKENALWSHSSSASSEYDILNQSLNFIKSEIGLDAYIHSAEDVDYDPQNKAHYALPGRVSLFIE